MNELDIVDRLSIHRTMSQYLTIDQLIFALNCDRAQAKAEIEHLRTELSELRAKTEAQAVPVALRYQRNDEIWTHVYYSQASCEYLSKKGIRYELLYTAPPEQAASVPVAWMVAASGDKWVTLDYAHAKECAEQAEARGFKDALRPLYTAPPEQAASAPEYKPICGLKLPGQSLYGQQTASVPDDWKLVQRGRVTPEMKAAGNSATNDVYWSVVDVFDAMLAAAPSPAGLDNHGATKPNDKYTFVFPDASMTKIRYIFVDGEMVYENLGSEQ